MNYYKYQDDFGPLGKAVTFVEIDEGRTIRQITVGSSGQHASNIKYPHWGMMLNEKHVEYDSIPEVKPIDRNEFDRIWQAHLASREVEWREAKKVCHIGKAVTGYIVVFYPQGVIIDLGNGKLGVSDYQTTEESGKPEFMYPGHKITGIVSGYDEQNQWIILDSPKVHEELRSNPHN
jgi:hypothetical protein